jgi:hypothetical protein
LPDPLGVTVKSPLEGPAQRTPFESQNCFGDLAIVVTVDPLEIVPVTDWLLTGIEVAPEGAPVDATVKAWPATVTVDPPGTAATNADTGIAVMIPLSDEVVAVRAGSSGGRSSLLTKPPFWVNPALKS